MLDPHALYFFKKIQKGFLLTRIYTYIEARLKPLLVLSMLF